MTDEEMIDEMGFFNNIQLEDGTLIPSRASMAVLLGLEGKLRADYKDMDEREWSLKTKTFLISALYEPMFRELEKKVKKGELTEVSCYRMLKKEGEELAKEWSHGQG